MDDDPILGWEEGPQAMTPAQQAHRWEYLRQWRGRLRPPEPLADAITRTLRNRGHISPVAGVGDLFRVEPLDAATCAVWPQAWRGAPAALAAAHLQETLNDAGFRTEYCPYADGDRDPHVRVQRSGASP
jgi:hypothetical protein